MDKSFSDIPSNLNVPLCLKHSLKQIPGRENRTVMIDLDQIGFASGAGEGVTLPIFLFIYLWLQWVFVAFRGLLFIAVLRLLIVVASLVEEHGL